MYDRLEHITLYLQNKNKWMTLESKIHNHVKQIKHYHLNEWYDGGSVTVTS